MAHKKGMGSSKNGRDSNPQFLGVKSADGQFISTGTCTKAHELTTNTKINADFGKLGNIEFNYN